MENDFLTVLKSEQNMTETENGDLSFTTSGSYILDLFSLGGAARNMSNENKVEMFRRAIAEHPQFAVRCMFYLRSPRKGQGERQIFRDFLLYLSKYHQDLLIRIIVYVEEFGRWDDLVYLIKLVPKDISNQIMEFLYRNLLRDVDNYFNRKSISLLAKWLPSINTSNSDQRKRALEFINYIQFNHESMSYKEYRQLLAGLRERIDVIEKKLTNNQWSEIKYENVPSKAMLKYRKAFTKHDEFRFERYLSDVQTGKKKMNMSVTYPHEVMGLFYHVMLDEQKYLEQENFIESAWKSLPNYAATDDNILVMADTSGSMSGTPLQIAVSLALYFAERNKGYFRNHFLTFSSDPCLQEIVGKNLFEKMSNLSNAAWEMNTDLRKAFMLLLDTAVRHKTLKSQFPKKIVIISDMQFDAGINFNESTFRTVKRKYSEKGFEVPQIVFWNVNASNKQVPVFMNEINTILISGYSPITFKYLLEGKEITPYDSMIEILEGEPFNKILI